jgi:ATP-dependent helicase/nuclease subunit A
MSKVSTKSLANSEQLAAINHSGGVVLQAGAGSGKTFVLKEHIFHLLELERHKLSNSNPEVTRKSIRTFYSKIALMTFTKKATSEIGSRIYLKIKEAAEEDPFFKVCLEEIDYLGINTIHGFCSKLLTSGQIDLIPTDYEIVSTIAIREKISKLFIKWYKTQSFENNILEKSIAKNLDQFISNFVTIFSKPELRLWWNKDWQQIVGECWPFEAKTYFANMLDLSNCSQLRDKPIGLEQVEQKEKTKTWYRYIEGFSSLINSHVFDRQGIEVYKNFFSGFKSVQNPKASEYLDFVPYIDAIKRFKDILKDQEEHLVKFFEEEDYVLHWFQAIHQAVSFIEEHYLFDHQYSFGDLEYYLLRFLRGANPDSEVFNFYQYYVIDEFQDTSWVQFEIIERLVKKDFSKVFLIGDIKQAIYGFRGGELGVFLKSLSLVPKKLELANNYRSLPQIIEFNNVFFKELFSKGMDFEGVIENAIEIHPQQVPTIDFPSLGEVAELNIEIQTEEKALSKTELDAIEAEGLCQMIESKLTEIKVGENICVLYRTLAPSNHLIALLLEKNISFSAQTKIPNGEDPIYCLSKLLLQFYLAFKKDLVYLPKMISLVKFYQKKYFSYLGLSLPANEDVLIKRFYQNINLMGLLESLQVYFFELGLCNSNSDNNLKSIAEVIRVCKGDVSKTYEYLNEQSSENYSLEFVSGQGARVIIMTVHASKGLQFAHVLLGGIHGHSFKSSTSIMGTLPLSFKFKINYQDKSFYKTPWYMEEQLVEKEKSFAESKRLFYVACTRAEKSLSWIRLHKENEAKYSGSGSWINALDSILNEGNIKVTRREESKVFSRTEIESDKPLFHLDKLGLENTSDPREMLLMADVSVTSLSTLSQCPRKFYLRNICKLDADYFGAYTPPETVGISSSARGQNLHAELSHAIKHNFVLSRDFQDGKDKPLLEWVLAHISNLSSEYELISEKEVKFSFFNQMVSGIPDLVLKPKEASNRWSIWDFKTGHRKLENEEHYWFQLLTYAYAYGQVFALKETDRFTLSLCYLDEMNLVSQEFELREVIQRLFAVWGNARHLEKIEEKHCRFCEYHNFCH